MPEQEQSSEVIQFNPFRSWWIQTSAEEHWMLYYHAIIKRHFLNDLVISATHNPSPRSLFCLNLNPISRVGTDKYYSEKILNKLFTSWWNFSSLSYFQIFILSFAYDFSSSSSSCHYISLFYWFVFHIFFNRLLRQSLPCGLGHGVRPRALGSALWLNSHSDVALSPVLFCYSIWTNIIIQKLLFVYLVPTPPPPLPFQTACIVCIL